MKFLFKIMIHLLMDILVYTPLEFEKLTTNPSFGFLASVVKELEQIF